MSELEIVRHAQIDGLSMFFNTVEYRTPHLHPEWELILVLEQPLLIACGEGSVELVTIQPEGKKPMTAEAFLAGHKLAVGDSVQ